MIPDPQQLRAFMTPSPRAAAALAVQGMCSSFADMTSAVRQFEEERLATQARRTRRPFRIDAPLVVEKLPPARPARGRRLTRRQRKARF